MLALAAIRCCAAAAGAVRIATYNVDCSDLGNNNNLTNVSTVVTAIGSHHINGNAQPVDVLALEELLDTNNNSITSTSLPILVADLNASAGAGTYAYDTTPDPTAGGMQFDGPSGLIYDTKTVKILSAVPLAFGGTNSIPRAPMRYLIQPLGYGINADFYLYVSHYKSGSGTANTATRNAEAAEIRADADALGANAHIIYSGDHNLFQDSSEPSYQTLLSAGQGQAHDPGFPSQVWTANAANVGIETESATNVEFRDDLQLTSSAVYNQSGTYLTPGLRLASSGGVNSYIVFGNGSSPSIPAGGTAQTYNATVNYSGNLTLNDLTNPAAILSALTVATDHLPVVADYNLVGVSLLPAIWFGGTGNWSNAANWNTSQVPTNPAVEVQIDNGNAISSVVTLDQNAGIADVILNAGDTLNLNAAATLALNGPATSTFNGTVNNAGIIAAVNLSIGSTAAFTSTGTLKVTGNLINQGTATIGTDIGATTPPSVNNLAGTLTFTSTEHLAGLNISAGSLVKLTRNNSRSVLITAACSIAGTLDLTNNDLDISGGNLTAITAMIKQSNIISGTAANDTAHLTTLGILQNNQSGTALFTAANPLDGTTPGVSDILVRFTYFGDANLDGKVDGSDYTRIDSGFLSHSPTWFDGDFNYDGVVNGSDYTLIDNAFNTQGAKLTTEITLPTSEIGSAVTVPEPVGCGLLTAILFRLSRRPRRGKK